MPDTEGDDDYTRKAIQAALNPYSARNFIENPSFDIAQRGTSFALTPSTTVQTLDRWMGRRQQAGGTISRQPGFNGALYCLRMQRDAGNTFLQVIYTAHQIESAVAAQLAGKTVVLSFDLRTGANFSGTAFNIRVNSGTGIDETFNLATTGFPTGGVNSGNLAGAILPAGGVQRLVCTPYAIPVDAMELAVRVYWTPTGTAGAADYLDITNMQLQIGSVATPFQPRPAAQEFDICRRYFERIGGSIADTALGTGFADGATSAISNIFFAEKRIMIRAAQATGLTVVRIVTRRDGVSIETAEAPPPPPSIEPKRTVVL